MMCEKCQSAEATVFLTQIVEGEMRKIDLCEKCAREMGVNQNTGFCLTDLLLKNPVETPAAGTAKACPHCGFSEHEFRKTGRLGCPNCYEFFSETVRDVIQDAQRASRHTGKSPHQFKEQIQSSELRRNLEEALATAIHSENYEQAALLRDQLKGLGGDKTP